ncbi:MAG: LysM peptidoglycan-binding domain-containing protein [Anaerolineae bacterium]|nr:LysM peptidoglycan-binding domain-containing protein [Anaerolineae bacterium]
MHNNSRFIIFLWFVILVFIPIGTLAQEEVNTMACEFDVVVQSDDLLSKIADKFLGNPLAYLTIVDATNAKSIRDLTYPKIEDSDVIEPGWKLCIPYFEDAQSLLKIDKVLGIPVPKPIDYNAVQFIWEWEGKELVANQDWYFDIKIYNSFNAPFSYDTLIADPTDSKKTQYFNGKWYSELRTNFQGCGYWAVQIAKRDASGNFEKHISPESKRVKVGPCEGGSTFSSPIR